MKITKGDLTIYKIIEIRQRFQVFLLFLSDKKSVLAFPFVWLRKTSKNYQI